MEIISELNGNELFISPVGKLNTKTSPNLAKEVEKYIGSVDRITVDLAKLEYISSAGLRVLLSTNQDMHDKGGEMIVKHVTGDIADVFEMTGFSNVLNVVN